MTDRPWFRVLTGFITMCVLAISSPLAQEKADGADESVPTQRLGAKELEADVPPDPNKPFVVPANDTCAGALSIPAAGPFPHLTATVDLFDATLTGDPTPSCSFTGSPCTTAPTCHSRGIWWTFTPSVTATYRLSTCTASAPGTTRSDTVLSVYTSAGGCAGPFVEVGCNDDDSTCGTSTLQSTASLGLNAGTTYYILAFSWNSTAPPSGASSVQLQVQQNIVTAPANDTCSGAVTLPLGHKLGTNAGAANDYTLSGTACFTGLGQVTTTAPGRDSVFSFTAPAAGSYAFRATTHDAAGSGNVVLYSSPTCPSPGAISCTAPVRAANRQANTGNFTASEQLRCQAMAEGETVYVFVDELALTGTGGGYLLEANRCGDEVEPNNTTAAAQALPADACPLIDGSISAGDVDFFDLGTPAAGTRVFAIAEAIQANNTDFDMRVTTTTDTLEYDDIDNSTAFGGNGPNIAGRALTGAQSYLRLNHFTATTNAEPYRLYSVTYPPGADPYGSSSSPEQRNATNGSLGGAEAAANNYFRGQANATNDLDAFLFCANEGDLITLQIDADPGRDLTPFNPAIFLFDELGTQIFGFSDAGQTSSNVSGAGSLTSTTPNSPGEIAIWRARYTGAYYAGVNAQAPVSLGDYLLSIGKNCSTDVVSDTATVDTDLVAPANITSAQEYDYSITLSNSGPKTASALEFTFPLPTGTTFVALDGTGSDAATCSQLPGTGQNGTVICRVECLRPGGEFTFLVTVKAPQCSGNVVVNASVSVTSVTALAGGSTVSDSASSNLTDDGTCDDGLFCTVGDACQGGSCVAAGPNECNDSDPCTLDSCEEASGCINAFSEGEICDDGDPCTSIDICLLDPGGCVGFKPLGSPGEVNGVGFDDKTTLSWGSDAASFTYDAVRGDVSALPVGPGGGDEVCFDNLTGTSTTDASLPSLGAGFWYLVRGENTCGSPAGTWGDATSGPRSTTTCP